MNFTLKSQIESLASLISQKEQELEKLKLALESLKDANDANFSEDSKSRVQSNTKASGKKINVDAKNRMVARNGDQVNLTSREFTLFTLLHKKLNSVCPRADLIELIGAEDKTPRNLDVHIYALRRKLKDLNIDIITEAGIGYMMTSEN